MHEVKPETEHTNHVTPHHTTKVKEKRKRTGRESNGANAYISTIPPIQTDHKFLFPNEKKKVREHHTNNQRARSFNTGLFFLYLETNSLFICHKRSEFFFHVG